MKIKAAKQRNFNTSTMTSSGNYNARYAQEAATELGVTKQNHSVKEETKR